MPRTFSGAAALAVAALPWTPSLADTLGEDTRDLQRIVVTATLTERDLADTLSSVSVIDRFALEAQQPLDLSEILRARPGVDAISNGPFGKTTSVYLRGTGGEQTLLLVDGVRMGSATTGAASWQFLPPRLVERIEVLRGPRASLYGADAMGGVVQVFTRAPGSEGFAPWVHAGAGSFASRQLSAGVSARHQGTGYLVAANHLDTEGIALRAGGERKGFRNTSLLAGIEHDFDERLAVGFTGLRSQGNTEFIGGDTDFVHQSLVARTRAQLLPAWEMRVNLHESRDESETSDDFGISVFDTRRRAAHWRNVLRLGAHEVVAGADYREDRVESSNNYDENSRYNAGVFAQALLNLQPVELQGSMRWDDHQAYGAETTGAAAAGYRIDASHRVRATYGTAFRAPSFNDLYFPGFGNPDLHPETSRTVELGVSGHYARWHWDAVLYRTTLDDLIETAFVGGAFAPHNVASARISGAEIAAGAEVADWNLFAALSTVDPVDRASGNRLRRRARESIRGEVDRRFGVWSAGATVIVQGHRYDDAAQEERLGGFGLLNLRAGWDVAANWALRLTVNNALDREYVTARDGFHEFDYRQPGRHFLLSIRYGADG